jgi:hypothetical protein
MFVRLLSRVNTFDNFVFACHHALPNKEDDMTTASKLRYEVKPRPARKQEPGMDYMVVDNRKVVAIKFGSKAECELAAFQMNDSGKVG